MATEFTLPAPANRVSSYYPSKVRELFAQANRPNMISFAGGMPNLTGLDLERIADLSARIIRDYGTMALQYSEGRGLAPLRARIAEIEAIEGPAVDPDHLIVTPAASSG